MCECLLAMNEPNGQGLNSACLTNTSNNQAHLALTTEVLGHCEGWTGRIGGGSEQRVLHDASTTQLHTHPCASMSLGNHCQGTPQAEGRMSSQRSLTGHSSWWVGSRTELKESSEGRRREKGINCYWKLRDGVGIYTPPPTEFRSGWKEVIVEGALPG